MMVPMMAAWLARCHHNMIAKAARVMIDSAAAGGVVVAAIAVVGGMIIIVNRAKMPQANR